jgi:hypothetical protein
MRCVLILLTVFVSLAAHAQEETPLYLDQMMEMPVATLQSSFEGVGSENCFQIGEGRYMLIDIQRKDQKPWRVALSSVEPCRRPRSISAVNVFERQGVRLGHSAVEVVEVLGRPDASAEPESALRRLGDIEYFYMCRVSEGCARHKSIFMRDGVVTAIAEWYSE